MAKFKLTRREFLKASALAVVANTMLSIIGYEYAAMIEPDWRQVTFLELALRRLPQEFHGYRLVQISDIHMDSWMTAERLSTVIKEVNGLGADMVAITGDFISEEPEKNAAILAEELTKISAKDGSVAVLGNHDHWTNPHEIRMALKKSGVINVSNSVHTIFRGASQLHFAGVDDIWENQDRLDLVLEMLPEEGCAILLAHEPDFADTSAATGRFDLQISGHSHGGQIIFPVIGPPVVPWLSEKYPLGLYQLGEMLQYTNRGIGMVGPPHVRFNCRPEITVFTLVTQEANV